MLSLSVVQLVFRAGERLSSGSLIVETLNSDALLASPLSWAEDSYTLFSFYFAICYFSQTVLQMHIHSHEGPAIVFFGAHWADLSTCWKCRGVKRGTAGQMTGSGIQLSVQPCQQERPSSDFPLYAQTPIQGVR